MFGHPKGLYVLFFTELWERFSFYGMKTLLVLYMINHFFWSQAEASSLLGTYAALAYGTPVLGGFIADRYLGAKRAVIVGAILLSVGHFLMAFEPLPFFYSALAFIIAGVGFLKPNVSTQVGKLYQPGDPRRDGAFTIFYMGINLGALIGPLLCDWLRVHYSYHYGFGAAGVGMLAGLLVYVLGHRKLVEFKQDAGDGEGAEADGANTRVKAAPQPEHPLHVVRDRVIVLLVVFAFVILFWMAFEQSANVLLVWADKHTNLRLASFEPPPVSVESGPASGLAPAPGGAGGGTSWWRDLKMTSGQTQSFNPFFIITLAPVFAFLWVWLDRRRRQPSTPTKMVLGLALVVVAFLVMWPAARLENRPSAAPLAQLPENLDLTRFGATRMSYDPDERLLHMEGVLTDLDRLRMLAETAPADFHAAVDLLVEKAEEKSAEAKRGEKWTLSEVVASAPAGMKIVGTEAEKVLRWDAQSKTLTVTGEIKERARRELLAAAAQPDFKEAIDRIYLDSSRFRVSVWWLILFFLFLTMGELCLSPVGLSLVTKLAPARHVGLFMGGWFLATAIAEKLAQVFGGMWGQMTPTAYFMMFVVICGVGALLMALLIRPLKRMMHGVQ